VQNLLSESLWAHILFLCFVWVHTCKQSGGNLVSLQSYPALGLPCPPFKQGVWPPGRILREQSLLPHSIQIGWESSGHKAMATMHVCPLVFLCVLWSFSSFGFTVKRSYFWSLPSFSRQCMWSLLSQACCNWNQDTIDSSISYASWVLGNIMIILSVDLEKWQKLRLQISFTYCVALSLQHIIIYIYSVMVMVWHFLID
jgi:hypothetical protein